MHVGENMLTAMVTYGNMLTAMVTYGSSLDKNGITYRINCHKRTYINTHKVDYEAVLLDNYLPIASYLIVKSKYLTTCING